MPADPSYAANVDAALAVADVNALRLALYQLTRDETLLSLPTRKVRIWGDAWQYTELDGDAAQLVRQRARVYLLSGRAKTDRQRLGVPSDEDTRRMTEAFTGDAIPDHVLRWAKEELAFDASLREVAWRDTPAAEALAAFNVLIVGAGMAGLATGMQLKRLGIPFTIIDRNGGVGGAWWVNDYPDARVDLPSHHYEFSFEKNYPWRHAYALQPELKQYFEHCAEKHGLNEHIELSTELVSAAWDDAASVWKAETRNNTTGNVKAATYNVVVSAIGVFHTANELGIPGLGDFQGETFHTTQWNHGYDLRDKRVAMIGNGSSGVQLMPWLARNAARLTIFQRTPTWMMEVPGYKDTVPEEADWLAENMPFYLDWHRFGLFYSNLDDAAGLQEQDAQWQERGGRISERHDRMSAAWERYLHSKLGDDPVLFAKLRPTHLPWAKRPVVESGWYESLRRENVELVTDGIEKITPSGVLASDGRHYEADVIVQASGFQTQKYLWPVEYLGRKGLNIRDFWSKDGARAYLGMLVPHFPNLFILYGPNGQPRTVSNFSWSELWARFVALSIREIIERGCTTMEVREDVFDDYNARMDKAMEKMIWDYPGQTNYYINDFGRVGHNMPWRPDEYYCMIERPNPDDYEFSG